MNSAILICTPNELGGIKTVGVDYTNFSKSDGQTGVKNNAPPPPPGGGGAEKKLYIGCFLDITQSYNTFISSFNSNDSMQNRAESGKVFLHVMFNWCKANKLHLYYEENRSSDKGHDIHSLLVTF